MISKFYLALCDQAEACTQASRAGSDGANLACQMLRHDIIALGFTTRRVPCFAMDATQSTRNPRFSKTHITDRMTIEEKKGDGGCKDC